MTAILREYLYVDLEKVRGLASQLYEGVPETAERKDADGKKYQLGSSRLAYMAGERVNDVTEIKSLADALFPILESDLEVEGYLADISDIAADGRQFASGELKNAYPNGSLIRLTCDGRLMDPRYFAKVLAGFATAIVGFDGLSDQSTTAPSGGGRGRGQGRSQSEIKYPAGQNPEDMIPDIPNGSFSDIDAKQMRSMVRVLRGMYPEGVSMSLEPAGVDGPTISIRLQEGRQYLEAEPETLFARYGLDMQEWTVIGTIGHHAGSALENQAADISFLEGDVVNRGKFTAFVNQMLGVMGITGFLELPQAPGFSLVPVAVYRTIPRVAFVE